MSFGKKDGVCRCDLHDEDSVDVLGGTWRSEFVLSGESAPHSFIPLNFSLLLIVFFSFDGAEFGSPALLRAVALDKAAGQVVNAEFFVIFLKSHGFSLRIRYIGFHKVSPCPFRSGAVI